MQTIEHLLEKHPFFHGIDPTVIQFIAGCGRNKVYKSGDIIAHEGDKAKDFYLIRKGKVNINTVIPNQNNQTVQTLSDGDICGWSWLFEPYRWMFEVVAANEVHLTALDGECLRKKCEAEPALGYTLMKRFSQLMINRLNATRLQLLDVYGSK